MMKSPYRRKVMGILNGAASGATGERPIHRLARGADGA